MEIPQACICGSCKKEVPLHELRHCSQCRPQNGQSPPLYCINICYYCRTRNCSTPGHLTCWKSHLPRIDLIASEHSPIDPLPHMLVAAVTYSEENKKAHRELHGKDRVAQWFAVKPDNSPKGGQRLYITDRFRQLCDPGAPVSDNKWSKKQYPGFVSFIGNTGIGKSTLVRAMLWMGRLDPLGDGNWDPGRGLQSMNEEEQQRRIDIIRKALKSNIQGPVTRSANLADLTLPTSFGVHLYKDEAHIRLPSTWGFPRPEGEGTNRNTPLLFADCEGFGAGSAIANAQHCEMAAGPETRQSGLISDLQITAPGFESGSGKDPVDWFYARFLYTISDVIVFVMSGDTKFHDEMRKLLEWAESAIHRAVNLLPEKKLIIVRNMASSHHQQLYDEHILKRILFDGLAETLWKGSKALERFVFEFNQKQSSDKTKIHSNEDILKFFFTDKIQVCYIPDTAKAPANEIFKQYQALRRQIVEASQRCQLERSKAWMQYNVPMLSHILNRAFEHFRTSDEPFDFYKAAQNDNPSPVSVAEHIANFLRRLHAVVVSHLKSSPDKIQPAEMVPVVISVALVSWAVRVYSAGAVGDPENIFKQGLLYKWCEDGLKIFADKDQQCGATVVGGGECVNRKIAHKYEHCDTKGNTSEGEFNEKYQVPEGTLNNIRRHFIEQYTSLFRDSDGNFRSPSRESACGLRESALSKFRDWWKRIRSNKTCFTCFQAVPDIILRCGHSLCPRCIQEFGKRSDYFEDGWTVDHCVLCLEVWTDGNRTYRLHPRCAGVRALTLDGGGIRGIVELVILEKLHETIGLEIPLRDFFDIIVGTSTGGIIALALAVKENLSIRKLKEEFMELASKTFGKDENQPGVVALLDPFKWTPTIFLILHIWDSLYTPTPFRDALKSFFGSETKLFSAALRSVRVAVISSRDNGADQCFITNYNRPNLGNDHDFEHDFEREDEPEKEMKIWEAGLATASAPFYFPKFEKPETQKNYTDGALHANFPVPCTLDEISRIWKRPDEVETPLDILITVGTGIQDREIKIPAALRIGGFAEICTSFHNNLDCEKKWRDFERGGLGNDSRLRNRVHRLNAHIEGRYVKIDDYKRMKEIAGNVAKQTEEEFFPEKLECIAQSLIASLFFFEPATIPDIQIGKSLSGTIRCRLSRNHRSVLRSLLKIIDSFWYKEINDGTKLPRDTKHWQAIPIPDQQRNSIRNYDKLEWLRVDCEIIPSKDQGNNQVLAVTLKRRSKERKEFLTAPIPISGFPIAYHKLLAKAKSR